MSACGGQAAEGLYRQPTERFSGAANELLSVWMLDFVEILQLS